MGELVKIPPSLEHWLMQAKREGVTWYHIWKPLKKAIDSGKDLKISGNVVDYVYDHGAGLISVYAILEEDAEVHIRPEDFQKAMAPYLRGTPE